MKVKDWKNVVFESSTNRTKQYILFERQCKKELIQQCEKNDLILHSFHPNHFEWSAVVRKNDKFIYIHLGDVRFSNWYDDALVRTMAHPTDWRGGKNNKCRFDQIGEIANNLLK